MITLYFISASFLSIMISLTGNVFMSLMYAVLLYINATVILLCLGFEFLSLVNLLVYVGALAVLFLFVIMLLEVPTAELRGYYRGYSVLGLSALIITRFSMPLNYSLPSPLLPEGAGGQAISLPCASESISNIGYAFYVVYSDILILNSLILTIALIGALVIAQKSA